MKKILATCLLVAVPAITLTAPVYAFEAVEAPSVHVSEPSVSEHATSSESSSHSAPSETFSSREDTNGTSNYHATYPYWVYASHPTTDCEQSNKDCPPTDPKQLAKYNAQKHRQAVIAAWTVAGVLFIGGLIAAGLTFTM